MEEQQKIELGKYIRKLTNDYYFTNNKLSYIGIAMLVLDKIEEIEKSKKISD